MPPHNGSGAVQPKDSIIERAKERRRKPGKWWDFDPLLDGKRKRRKPAYLRRTDGQYLFYHGKENAIYGETEAGKDMLLAELTVQSIEDEISVAWIDFEEGEEIDVGFRMLELGVEPADLRDQSLFLFATPEDVEEAKNAVHDAIGKKCDIIIFNGVQAAYSLFGWDISSPDSTRMFRNELVRPCLNAGRTVIETDHISKASSGSKANGNRYASGGMAKLNWVSGAAYMLVAQTPIVRGSVGTSLLMLSKDRPSGVKPACNVIDNDPRMMYAGRLVVKSTGNDDDWSLSIDITPPRPLSDNSVNINGVKVPVDVIENVIQMYKDCGEDGTSKNYIEKNYKGVGSTHIRAAIEIAKAHGCIVQAKRTRYTKVVQLKYKKNWGSGPKIRGKQ